MRPGTVFYRWSVSCTCGRSAGGYADTIEIATDCIHSTRQLYTEQGRNVKAYAVFNQGDCCVLSVEQFQ